MFVAFWLFLIVLMFVVLYALRFINLATFYWLGFTKPVMYLCVRCHVFVC